MHLELNSCSFGSDALGTQIFQGAHLVERLIFRRIAIRFVDSNAFIAMRTLSTLVLHKSTIVKLKQFALNGLHSLLDLNLSNLHIFYIANCAFCNAERLLKLNLSSNHIEKLNIQCFAGMPKISEIDLRFNPIQFIEPRSLFKLHTNLYFTLPYYCCYTNSIQKCMKINELIMKHYMCKTIFEDIRLEIVSIIIALAVCLLNVAAITFQRTAKDHRILYILTKKRFICNILLTLFCFSLLTVSLLYGDDYILYETGWITNNKACSCLRYYIMSVILICTSIALLIAVNQFIATKYALKYQPLTSTQCNACLTIELMLIVIGIVALVVVDEPLSRDIYCFPFEIIIDNWKLYMYSTYFFILLIMIIAVLSIHAGIISHVHKSAKNISSTLNHDKTLHRLLSNACVTVSIELFTWLMMLIAAVCHNTESFGKQLRLSMLLIAIYAHSSVHAINYLQHELMKYVYRHN